MVKVGIIFAAIFFAVSLLQWIWIFWKDGADKFIRAVKNFYKGKYEDKFPYSICYKPIVIRFFSTIMFGAGILGLILAVRQ